MSQSPSSRTGSAGPVVDVHAHVIVPDIESAVAGMPGADAQRALDFRRNGAESAAVSGKMFGARVPQLTQIDVRLADMDRAGIDIQVLSVSPSQYHYWAQPDLAMTVCRSANQGVAAVVAEEPARFRGLGLVPLQHPELMVQALEHAVIDCGLAGVEISSHAPEQSGAGTVELSDDRLDAFWSRAAELAATVFLHPFGCTLDERLDRFYLSNTVGQPVENAVALSHMIFAGVLDRHPGLKLIAAHGGGYLPTFLGRSDHAWAVRPEAQRCKNPPSSYVRQLWFDSLVHTPESLRTLVAAVGADRVLLGSDYPFDMGVTDPAERIEQAGLTPGESQAILSGNALRLGFSTEPSNA